MTAPLMDEVLVRSWSSQGGLHCAVSECGSRPIQPWWNRTGIVQPHWLVYCNEQEGVEIIAVDGTRRALQPGAIWLLPPGSGYGRRVRGRVQHLWVQFEVAGVSPEVIAGLPPGPQPVAGDARLRPAILRIERDFRQPLYNQGLAAVCGLGTAQFCRLFRHHVGCSPAQYIIERRIAQATILLLTTAQPIGEIAQACGFPDSHYLSRVFLRRTGCRPADYRKRR